MTRARGAANLLAVMKAADESKALAERAMAQATVALDQRDAAFAALRLASRTLAMAIGTHGDPCRGGDCVAMSEFRATFAAIDKVLKP